MYTSEVCKPASFYFLLVNTPAIVDAKITANDNHLNRLNTIIETGNRRIRQEADVSAMHP